MEKKVSTGDWKNTLLVFKGECMTHGGGEERVQENKMKKGLTASDKKYIFFPLVIDLWVNHRFLSKQVLPTNC